METEEAVTWLSATITSRHFFFFLFFVFFSFKFSTSSKIFRESHIWVTYLCQRAGYFHVISIESLLVGSRAVEWSRGLSGFGRRRQASRGSRVEKWYQQWGRGWWESGVWGVPARHLTLLLQINKSAARHKRDAGPRERQDTHQLLIDLLHFHRTAARLNNDNAHSRYE